MATGIDKDSAIKEQAGSKRLSAYSNCYEVETLCKMLNTDHETILNSDDGFCTKMLIANTEKQAFNRRYAEIKRDRAGKK